MDEKQFIGGLEQNYFDGMRGDKYYEWKKEISISKYEKHILNSNQCRLLELGCSIGVSTSKLARLVNKVVCIEGVESFIFEAKKLVKEDNVTFINSLFEDIVFDNEFDYVVADYILEHVEDVDDILTRCYRALKPNGLLFSSVPNAQAFSRQMAVEMGLMKSIYGLTENDYKFGHRRIYDIECFRNDITRNGFKVVEIGGSFFKPFADFQLKKMIASEIISKMQFVGLIKMGELYPHLCEGIYAVSKKVTASHH